MVTWRVPIQGPRLLGPSPALLASARPPEANSTLLPTEGGGTEGSRQAPFPIYLHTLVHTHHPRACAYGVCP